jgi:hypothetical protein
MAKTTKKKTRTEKDEVRDDVGKYASLTALTNSEGGKRLLAGLRNDILEVWNELVLNYKDAPHTKLIACIAKFEQRWMMYRALTNARINQSDAQERLDEILEEEAKVAEEER